MQNEAIKHHYIPQFILKNFCFDSFNHINYYDIKKSELYVNNTREVFMQRNLYRDEINHEYEPTQLEKDLSKYENEVAKIIKRFLEKNDIEITLEEKDSLLLFFAIMALRSINTLENNFKNAKDSEKEFYAKWQENGDLEDLWKRNLGWIVNCRSIEEVIKHPNVDEPFKFFMVRDTISVFGNYFIVLERRGGQDFLIGDCYPVVITGDIMNIHMFSYFPISPNRIIIIASNGVEGAPLSVRKFDDNILQKPKMSFNRKHLNIHVKKIYESQVNMINNEIIRHSQIGLVFKDADKVRIPITEL